MNLLNQTITSPDLNLVLAIFQGIDASLGKLSCFWYRLPNYFVMTGAKVAWTNGAFFE